MAAVDGSSSFSEGSVYGQPCEPTRHGLQVFCCPGEVDNLLANGHHLPSDPVDNPVNSGSRHPKRSGDHPVGCPTCQPEEEHQGLDGGTPSVSPFLTQEVQQRVQGLTAQPKIWPCVLVIKEPVQDRDGQIYPAVQGSWL